MTMSLLKSLQHFELYSCAISSPFPTWITNFTSLTYANGSGVATVPVSCYVITVFELWYCCLLQAIRL